MRTLALPCYVALLHGSGPDLSDQMSPASPAMERYWNPAGDPALSIRAQASSPEFIAGHCTILRVGYDGGSPWWHVRAAGRAARALNDFIDEQHISDGGLILVGHSMGGLIARYIVNNGAPESPYYDEYLGEDRRMSYDVIRRKTAAIVTVATPHTGTEAADALYGDADHVLTNVAAGTLRLLGVARDSPANASLTRAYLEAAGGPGGEMGDEGRTIPLLTIAGTVARIPQEVGPEARVPIRADHRLSVAWSVLCAEPSLLNLWGLACGYLPWRFQRRAGDGVIERSSAHGAWLRESPNGRRAISGPCTPWLDRPVNHSQGRYAAQAFATVSDLLSQLEAARRDPR